MATALASSRCRSLVECRYTSAARLVRDRANQPGRAPAVRAPVARRLSQSAGRNAAHCPGLPLQRPGHPKILSSRSAKAAPQKASSGPTLERRRPLPTQRAWRRGPGQRPGPNDARRTSTNQLGEEDQHGDGCYDCGSDVRIMHIQLNYATSDDQQEQGPGTKKVSAGVARFGGFVVS